MAYLLGVDVSTTGAKAILINEDGQVIASATTSYSLSTPQPLWSEQSPADWWNGAAASIREAMATSSINSLDIKGIGLTGQMHGLVLLDRQNQVLRPAILWNDQRTARQCEEMTRKIGQKRLLWITGNPALTGFTAPKILWVRENEPEIYAQIAHILLPKDYIRFKLTGDYAIDCAEASGTSLLDFKQRMWSAEVLEILEIDPTWLPKVVEGPQVTGVISLEAAAITGLKAGTPVVGGGGDQAAQSVGVGAITPGIIALTLGTSGVVFAPTGQPFIEAEGRLHAMCHSVPGNWHLMGVMLSAAGSLRWLRDTFAPGTAYDDLLLPASLVEPGSDGLIFLPYLTGERTPYPDPLARGAFVGLTLRHNLASMTRSVLEGVAFGLRDSMELVKGSGLGKINQVRVSGGGSRSALWRQILADTMACELVTVNVTEGASYGAALLAGVGAGLWPTVNDACAATVRVLTTTQPQAKSVERYQEIYPVYRSLYPALKSTFPLLA
ncbi:MAG TPA: xylulokinase [Anaerolineaceae bacterium]|jgi:xylulokinase